MALPSKIQLQIVSADRSLVNEQVDEVEIPGADGYFGVLPGHTPLLGLLGTGELWYRQGAETHYVSLAFGLTVPPKVSEVPLTVTADPVLVIGAAAAGVCSDSIAPVVVPLTFEATSRK